MLLPTINTMYGTLSSSLNGKVFREITIRHTTQHPSVTFPTLKPLNSRGKLKKHKVYAKSLILRDLVLFQFQFL